jgi:putative addiction module component (TIGR02574 family)
VLELSPTARAYLAEVLLQGLDHEEDFSVSNEWLKEIHKRCREIDEEKTELITAEDALDQLQKKYL